MVRVGWLRWPRAILLPAVNTLPLDNTTMRWMCIIRHSAKLTAGLACAGLFLAGCSDRRTPTLATTATAAASPQGTSAGKTSAPSAASAELFPKTDAPATTTPQGHPKQWWEAVYAGGVKIGWGQTALVDIEENGKKLQQVDSQNHLAVDRDRQRTTIDITTRSIETSDGKLLRFETEMLAGASRTLMTGKVADGKLTVETSTHGKTVSDTLPCPADTLGFSSTDQSLARAPMLAGQKRTLKALMPATNEVVTIELAADKFESTALLDHSEDLLRIESTITLPINMPDDKPPVIRSVLWANREGQILKTAIAALHQETFRTTREVALAESSPRRVDLVIDNTIPVARLLDDPHNTRRVRYRVWLEADDPAKVFFSGRLQEVQSLDPHTAEITVRRDSGAPKAAGDASPPRRLPGDDDRKPNNLVQSDDPVIVAMAKSVAPNEADPLKVGIELEKLVRHTIKLKDFSQAFATASEVARNPEGDCTEHSVLLAALARARGIAARVAIGLVYQDGKQSFAYHMWNEIWTGDRWVPLDATLGRGGIGAAHLMLTDSNLAGAQAYSCFLPVAQVIGQLKIEILDVE